MGCLNIMIQMKKTLRSMPLPYVIAVVKPLVETSFRDKPSRCENLNNSSTEET